LLKVYFSFLKVLKSQIISVRDDISNNHSLTEFLHSSHFEENLKSRAIEIFTRPGESWAGKCKYYFNKDFEGTEEGEKMFADPH
jgi:hypothetical protein